MPCSCGGTWVATFFLVILLEAVLFVWFFYFGPGKDRELATKAAPVAEHNLGEVKENSGSSINSGNSVSRPKISFEIQQTRAANTKVGSKYIPRTSALHSTKKGGASPQRKSLDSPESEQSLETDPASTSFNPFGRFKK